MNTMIDAPTIHTLADRAMLVRLKIGRWSPYKRDDRATAVVEMSEGVSKAGNFNKRLMRESRLLTEANQALDAVYLYHMQHSVPWLDEGVRMIPSAAYLSYTQEIRGLIHEANVAADRLEAGWSAEVMKDFTRLGKLGNIADYPGSVRPHFYIDGPRFQPIPTEGDFRVEISDEDRQSLANCIKDAEEGVRTYIIKELMTPVQKAVDKLSVGIGEEGSVFRDSLVENVVDAVMRMGRLNINNDPEIADMLRDVNTAISAVAVQPHMLRESQVLRDTTKDRLAEVMGKMSAFMGGTK